MPVIIEEVTAEAIKPVAPTKTAQPPTEQPGDATVETRRIIAQIRRSEARAQRLRAD
ncbi:hypothetical protein [Parerythrobacter aestuarii]|uniref:hypothetical protein n=1 Tax=Parerythrobacter aestuarii TaxID=3020909 RepID=UPI0024DEFEA8|nr:hypothetical protein [Parerythrobacter aestuarii]